MNRDILQDKRLFTAPRTENAEDKMTQRTQRENWTQINAEGKRHEFHGLTLIEKIKRLFTAKSQRAQRKQKTVDNMQSAKEKGVNRVRRG